MCRAINREVELADHVVAHATDFAGARSLRHESAQLGGDKPQHLWQLVVIHAASRHDERRFALRLLNALLGECMSSRLFQSLREDRGIAYDVHSSVSFFADCGDLSIYAGVDEDKLEQVLRLIAAELRRLAAKAPSASEIHRVRDYVIGQFDLALEGTEPHMTWLGEQLIGHGELIPAALTRERLAAVTPAQIRATARDFFRPGRFNLALVSPMKRATHLAPLLKLD